MSSSKEAQAAFITPPLANNEAMKCIARIVVSNAGISQSMTGIFGGTWADGEYVTITADGAKIDWRMANHTVNNIDAFETGVGDGIAYPLADGAMMSFVPVGGRMVGSGISVTAGFVTTARFDYLQAKVRSGGVATAYLCLYRNVGPGKDAGSLRAP